MNQVNAARVYLVFVLALFVAAWSIGHVASAQNSQGVTVDLAHGEEVAADQ